MSQTNRLMAIVHKTASLPAGLQTFVLSKMFGRVVPMVGTAGIRRGRSRRASAVPALSLGCAPSAGPTAPGSRPALGRRAGTASWRTLRLDFSRRSW